MDTPPRSPEMAPKSDSQECPTEETTEITLPLKTILRSWDKARIGTAFRLTPKGLFIESDSIELFRAALVTWHQAGPGTSPFTSEQALMRACFGQGMRPDAYFLEGKACLVGKLLKVFSDKEGRAMIPTSSISPLTASNYIHIRDPIFHSCSGLSLRQSSGGSQLVLRSGQQEITCRVDAIAQFAELAKNSRPIQSTYPLDEFALRDYIPILLESLTRARPPKAHQHVLVPSLEKRGALQAFISVEFSFVVGQYGALIGMYGRRGKNLANFIAAERRRLVERPNKKQLGAFRLSAGRDPGFGTVVAGIEKFVVEPSAIGFFLERALHLAKGSRKLPRFCTLAEGLRSFSDTLSAAREVAYFALPKDLQSETEKQFRFLQYEGIYFELTARTRVRRLLLAKRPMLRRQESSKNRKALKSQSRPSQKR